MSIKKQFVSYTEKFERIVLTQNTRKIRKAMFCTKCKKDVFWLTLFEASAVTGKGPDELSRMIANGELDFMISEHRQFLVCTNSFTKDALT